MNEYVTIKQASSILNISEATCRNWIKSKILDSIVVGNQTLLFKNSIDNLLSNNFNGRLSSRRNKTKKTGNILSLNYIDDKNEQHAILEIINSIDGIDSISEIRYILKCCSISLLKKYNKFNDDGKKLVNDLYLGEEYVKYNQLDFSTLSIVDDPLGALYMCLKKVSDRKNGGMYYTPASVVNSIFENIKKLVINTNDKSIIDICCGTGNFLIKALQNGFTSKNVYGRDFDEISVYLTRINIYLRSDLNYNDLIKQIKISDSLQEVFDKYDFCVGNPPWGSELSIDLTTLTNKFEVAQSKSIDPFCLFIEKGIKLTKTSGYLYYVCPEALCNVGIHESTRKFLQERGQLVYLSYLGNAFDGVQSPAITICVRNNIVDNFCLNAYIQTANENYQIIKNREITPKLWDFNISNKYYEIINKVFSMENIEFLKNKAIFALGIVTGDNKKFVLTNSTSKSSNLVKGSNVYKYSLNLGEYYLEYDRKNFQQVAQDEIYFATEKLIYRFISDTLVFAYDDKQTLTLNSANICIPKIEGLSIKYVLAILNSRLSHFIFKLKFNSIKVLRNHIESLPIIHPAKCDVNKVESLVNKILICTDFIEKESLYNELDDFILSLYDLNDEEKKLIKNFNSNNIFL